MAERLLLQFSKNSGDDVVRAIFVDTFDFKGEIITRNGEKLLSDIELTKTANVAGKTSWTEAEIIVAINGDGEVQAPVKLVDALNAPA